MKKLITSFTILLTSLLLIPILSGQSIIDSNDLEYIGSFKLPDGGPDNMGFSYGGTALTYHELHNSIYLVGHDYEQLVAEIGIPELVQSQNPDDYYTATLLQEFTDPSEGMMYTVDEGTIKIGGLYVHEEKLIGSAFCYYDADANQVFSHFTSDTVLNIENDALGMFQLGEIGAGYISGYMGSIPASFQDTFGGVALVGQSGIPIISRTSYGPGVFSFNPNNLPVDSITEINPLVYYPQEHPLAPWDSTNLWFNGSTSIGGVVFPENSSSILFFGVHGIGEFCYGTGEDCNDPINPHQGTHAYPYRYQVWSYDVNDILHVRAGLLEPWEVEPDNVWELTLPIDTDSKQIGGVAYDASSQTIYISQMYMDGIFANKPFIHAFKIKRGEKFYVDANLNSGDDNGQDWANAFHYLQDALHSAEPGDTLLLAGGNYYPDEDSLSNSNNREALFSIPTEVIIIGGYNSITDTLDPTNQITLLSGDIDQNDILEDYSGNSTTVVKLNGAEIQNLVIQSGNANESGIDELGKYGAGVFATGNNKIINCIIKNNKAIGSQNEGRGGGIYFKNGISKMINCQLKNNVSSGNGKAIYIENGSLILVDENNIDE